MQLSHAQRSAYLKLSPMFWKSAYDVRASMATMEALVKKGWAESKGHGSLGSMKFYLNPPWVVFFIVMAFYYKPTRRRPGCIRRLPSGWGYSLE